MPFQQSVHPIRQKLAGFIAHPAAGTLKQFLTAVSTALAVAAAMLAATASDSLAAGLTLAWNAGSPAPEGYCVYSHTEKNDYDYSLPIWEGTGTTCTLADLEDSTTYSFVVRAHAGGEYSGNSNEVTYKTASANQTPIANAGAHQTISSGQTVMLDGAASMDPDGEIVAYTWAQTSGTPVTLNNASSARSGFTAPEATQSTQLAFSLMVTDDDGLTASDICTITVEPSVPSNRPPAAEAGPNQRIAAGSLVQLDGAGSNDPENQPLSFRWVQKTGLPVELIDAASARSSFQAPQNIVQSHPLTFELTVTDSLGLSSGDTCIVLVEPVQPEDSDGDGVADGEDAFPEDETEWMDSDGDGIGDNADTDDDNDGMPDAWEIHHNLNPYADDAHEDPDNDGISNLDEYRGDTDPHVSDANTPPARPAVTYPLDGADDISVRPQLEADAFTDADSGDTHARTQWQLVEKGTSRVILDTAVSKKHLNKLRVPRLVLSPSGTYLARVRYFDNHDTPSEWSADVSFTTEPDLRDKNKNGIPDAQEVDAKADVNRDGVADWEQETIVKSVQTSDGLRQMAVSIQSSGTAADILVAEQFDANDLENPPLTQKQIPYGLLGFKIEVEKPGDTAKIRRFFSGRLDGKTQWVRYNDIGGWRTCVDCVQPVEDGYGADYELKDGEASDADGTENGIIVDLSGPRTTTADDGGMADPDGGSAGSSGSGGSCFIRVLLDL